MIMASDDDFGPFVGPLDIPPSPERSPPHKKFLANAQANTDRNRKAILDELLAHQDDPLFRHKPSPPTPAPPIASTPTVTPTLSAEQPVSSWFSALHERIPSTQHALPAFTRSFFSAPQHAESTPAPSSTVKHAPSPFAAHTFVPIPGAPGFKPDEYDWDKGFSTQLEHEAISQSIPTNVADPATPPVLINDTASMSTSPNPMVFSLGEFIDKKSGSVELAGRRISTVSVLSTHIAEKIRPHLPALSRLPRTWTLIYSLDQHGISLKTLYSKCEAATAAAAKSKSSTKINGMLFVVKDSDGAIFGAWMGDGLRMSRGNEGYYGSGESFLWKWVEGSDELRVFRWTGRNDYVALCEPGFISFGGGDGSYGLYLDDTLYEGTSARSITFANEVLCSSGPRLAGGAVGFECVGVEVWGVGS